MTIWIALVALLIYASRSRRHPLSDRASGHLILWGGAVLPSTVLAFLLGYALWLMPSLRPWTASTRAPGLRIEVVAEQFWWRVSYFPAGGGGAVISANEIRVPVGQRVEFTLKSNDVIHSFWIPSLGGKMDMIPGRTNRLSLMATKGGVFRGPCAEYCGISHALMAFSVVAMDQEAFRQWLSAQMAPAKAVSTGGRDAFLTNGCGACHTIKGTEAMGVVGPDLSHVGSRATLGAGILPNNAASIRRFIIEPDKIKPGVGMPAFGMLPREEIDAIAAYLARLK
jgi:cytochrome c oxidase subunit 2